VSRLVFILLFWAALISTAQAKKDQAPSFPPKRIQKKDCPAVDFSKKMGPARYQGGGLFGTSMCHAHAAADLITVNQGLSPENRVSALDVASATAIADPDEMLKAQPPARDWAESRRRLKVREISKFIQFHLSPFPLYARGGEPDADILAYNLRGSACTEKDLPSEKQQGDVNAPDLQDRVQAAREKRDTLFGRWRALKDCSKPDTLRDLVGFTGDFGRALDRQSDEIFRKSCRNKIPLRPMRPHGMETRVGEAAEITLRLFREGAPVAIGYDSRALIQKTLSREADHASTVAGSRWNEKTRTCEFKVRNSYGTTCKEHAAWPCEEGQYWIPEWQYNQMVTSLYYIEPQSP
jgi:hypothetical protein